jgi:arylsulfatase A-like enzyme
LARCRAHRMSRPIDLNHSSAPWLAGGLLALVIVTGFSVWTRMVSYRTPTGIALGRMPPGVHRSDLNLLVITLDTTRADRLGAYGFRGIQTPHLDRLAREGVQFDQTASAAPLTLPAHCSLFTGRLPPQHGVRENGVVLSSSEVTLATVLKSSGFQTAAVTGSFVVASKWGLNQGFDHYMDTVADAADEERAPHSLRRPANVVADLALDWLSQHERSRFFAWLHFYDAHAPYEPPEPFRTTYATDPYLGELAFVDAQLGRVLMFLESRQLLDRTIVVVIGDHGESLGEHGERTHGLFVYESVMRVPFIIRAPYARLRGRRVNEPTRSIDMLPTVLELLGVGSPGGVQGASLAGLMTGATRTWDKETYSESMYPRDYFGWSDLRASRAGRFKVIIAPHPELYDLVADPHELRNLYAERRALADRMAARLRAVERAITGDPHAVGAATSSVLAGSASVGDPDTRAQLASLGYIGSMTAPGVTQAVLPDPKDQIGLYNLITGDPPRHDVSGRPTQLRRMP